MSLYYDCGVGFWKSSFAKKEITNPVFLCGTGSSLNLVDKDIRSAGRIVVGLNTSYPKIIPDIWMGFDDPQCYHPNLFHESFIKILRGGYQDRCSLGGFQVARGFNTYFAPNSPCAIGDIFHRRAHETKFYWDWHTLGTSLHILVWMGVKELYFIGTDFGGNYFDDRKLDDNKYQNNLALYIKQVGWLEEFNKIAKVNEIRLNSCSPNSPINEFMPYIELSEALEKTSKPKIKFVPLHCTDAERIKEVKDIKKQIDKPVILHVNNYIRVGGVETFVLDCAKTLPEYQHVLLTTNNKNKDDDLIKYFNEHNVLHGFTYGKLCANTLQILKPELVLLHNQLDTAIDGDADFLLDYNTICVHHGATPPLPCRRRWFVSRYVRAQFLSRYKADNTRFFFCPPCVHEDDYIDMGRPFRKPPTIGRIQSETNQHDGKVTDEYFDLISQVDGVSFFNIVPHAQSNGKIMHGAMPKYLKEIDIMAIWGNTTETWSRVATEAMLSGIPVVARNHRDGLAEQLRKSGGGALVKTKEAFVEKLDYLANNRVARLKMAKRGQEWCKKNAGKSKLKKTLLELLKGNSDG